MMELPDGLRLPELFELQVARTPDATAVVARDTELTYRQLDALANGVARSVLEAGGGPGTMVGVCLGRDERLVAALLGVLKSGAAYVPLDPAYPAERLRFISEDARLACVVMTKDRIEAAAHMDAPPVLMEGVLGEEASRTVHGSLDDPAYVVYTSGSTGRPKGVVIAHSGAVNLMRWALDTYSAEEMSGCLAASSVCFDLSITELYPPLLTGGTVIVAESLLELPSHPARERVTMIGGPPSGLRALLHRRLPAGVRTVNPGGEVLTWSLVDLLFAQDGVQRIRNYYGPSECTTLSHCHDLLRDGPRDATAAPPIGRTVAGTQGILLDPEGRPVPDGEVGELWLAGPAVAQGYLRRPELTAERFVADDTVPGGRRYRTGDLVRRTGDLYHYVGRMDDQVKVRGFRIELAEVELVLTAHPEVHNAVAVAPADADGVRSLYSYVEPTAGSRPTEAGLRSYLRERLPAYMVPSRIAVLDRIPLNPNGKADRAALPPLDAAAPREDHVPPRNELETGVAAIMAEVLGVERVGVFDDFYDLGGHSLTAAQVVARVGAAHDRVVPLAWFLAESTVAGLARRLVSDAADVPPLTRHAGRQVYPLTGMQWSMWMLPRMWSDANAEDPTAQRHWRTIAFQVRLSGVDDAAAVRAALDGVVRRHESLRSIAVERDGEPCAVVQAPVPVPFIELDLRDLPPEQRPVRAKQLAREAADHVFDIQRDVPLIRVTLMWTGEREAHLAVIVDHFAFDGYSIGVLADELAAACHAMATGQPDPTPPPAVQVGDIAIFEEALNKVPLTEEAQGELARLRAEVAAVNVPNVAGVSRTGIPDNGRRVAHVLDPATTTALIRLEEACGVTQFALFAAAMGVLLRRLTGAPDNVIGAATALRGRPGVERVMGPLLGMVPVPVRTADGPSFRDLTARVTEVATRALALQEADIMEIVPEAGPGEPPGLLPPVVVSMQPASMAVVYQHGDVRVELLGEVEAGGAICDLLLLVNPTANGLELHLEYDVERFDHELAASILRRLRLVLAAAIADPDRPVSAYEID